MIQVQTISDAAILVHNKEHENFTDTGRKISANTVLKGNPTIIKGKRKGEPFDYKLFVTDKNDFIYLNKIKPMRTTEVTLGADAAQTPTLVDMARPKLNLTKWTIGGALAGAGAAYYYSAKMKNMERNKVILYSLVGLVAGFYVGKAIEKRRPVKITPSK